MARLLLILLSALLVAQAPQPRFEVASVRDSVKQNFPTVIVEHIEKTPTSN